MSDRTNTTNSKLPPYLIQSTPSSLDALAQARFQQKWMELDTLKRRICLTAKILKNTKSLSDLDLLAISKFGADARWSTLDTDKHRQALEAEPLTPLDLLAINKYGREARWSTLSTSEQKLCSRNTTFTYGRRKRRAPKKLPSTTNQTSTPRKTSLVLRLGASAT